MVLAYTMAVALWMAGAGAVLALRPPPLQQFVTSLGAALVFWLLVAGALVVQVIMEKKENHNG